VIVQRRLEPSRPFALNAENPHRFPGGLIVPLLFVQHLLLDRGHSRFGRVGLY